MCFILRTQYRGVELEAYRSKSSSLEFDQSLSAKLAFESSVNWILVSLILYMK